MSNASRKEWALVLGASSGFGAAAALELARAGTSIFGVHLDRKAGMANVERLVEEHETRRVDHSQRLYALLMLELWWQWHKGL